MSTTPRVLQLFPSEETTPELTPAWPSSLPLPLTRLIGRDGEVAAIGEALRSSRLVTLIGPGGIGKTRLALEVASANATAFPDGVLFVELAALGDATMVSRAVASALALDEPPNRPLDERLIDALRSRALLLVLDNCEHLIEACATLVDALLRACPRLQVLATSREGLAIGGEVAWRVPPLAVPPDDAHLLASGADDYAAVHMFIDRATAARPDFVLTDQNVGTIARVCRRLDGIPLALELAAALVPALTVDQVADRLDDAIGLLAVGRRTAPTRQRGLRATLDWSFNLLSEPERTTLRRAAVFAGGWTLSGAERVCSDENLVLPSDVLQALVQLVAKSLVQVERVHATRTTESRYRLLETVRQYASERLREAGEDDLVRRKHGDWCAELVEQAEPRLFDEDQLEWLARLDREYDNIRAALGWCLEHDPPLGLRIAASLWQFWRMRLFLTEGRQWLEDLLARAPDPTPVRARALAAAGTLANWQLDSSAARDHYTAALELSRRYGQLGLTGRVLRELASLTSERFGDHERAWVLFEEGLALSRAADDRRNVATNLRQQGRLASVEGQFRRAGALLDESVALLRTTGDRWQLAIALENAGEVALVTGQPDLAMELFEEAFAVGQVVEAAGLGTIHRRFHLGTVAYWRGDASTAIAWYEHGLAITREKEHTAGITDNLIGLGRAVLLQRDSARARELFAESLRLSQARGDSSGTAVALHGLGLAAWQAGDAALAVAYLGESLAVRRDLDDRLGIVECLEALSVIAARQATSREQTARAMRWLGAADALRAHLGAPRPPVDRPDYASAVELARTWLDDPTDAALAGGAEPLEATLADVVSALAVHRMTISGTHPSRPR